MLAWLDDDLESVEWDRLSHAYGTAAETPRHLRGLLALDPMTREQALLHLWGTVMHQGSIYTVTAPVAELIARMLPDRHFDTATCADGTSLREHLLSFLAHVAMQATYCQTHPDEANWASHDDVELPLLKVFGEWGDDPTTLIVGQLGAGSAYRAAAVLEALMPWLDSPRTTERDAATITVACWAALPGGARPLPALVTSHLRYDARDRKRPMPVRLACVLGLVGAGADTGDLLDDESIIVRTCAALSPTVSTDPRTLPVIGEALADKRECDSWIPDRAPVPHLVGTLSAHLVEMRSTLSDCPQIGSAS